ncbi:hypothetical protein [Luteimonas sp. R10]|uniref:hypothetical protein n=1 Tax=Luteimonas sp. R10 TaxID=3108176 RepID=UPI0030890A8D|nr:hypothetical protein U3649_11205 [Luteimonas sp. R10]
MLRPFPFPTILLLAALAAVPAVVAQERMLPAQPPAAPQENVRIDYAKVLSAEPVHQTLRATSMVERCDPATPVRQEEDRRGLSRVVGAVRDVLTPSEEIDEVAPSAGGDCRMVPIEREFRRPIGYDVDYVYKGVKYRSRLPYDPGNRVRVRVSVTPVVSSSGQ